MSLQLTEMFRPLVLIRPLVAFFAVAALWTNSATCQERVLFPWVTLQEPTSDRAEPSATKPPIVLPAPAGPQSNGRPARNLDPTPLSRLKLDVGVSGSRPRDDARQRFARAGRVEHTAGFTRDWSGSEMSWEAPALCHGPLYFEEINLERYGHHVPVVQPILSAAHFFGRLPALPYLWGAKPRHGCYYTLGHYRPGDCVPHHLHRPPLSLRGAAYQAAATTGFLFAVP